MTIKFTEIIKLNEAINTNLFEDALKKISNGLIALGGSKEYKSNKSVKKNANIIQKAFDNLKNITF